MQARCWSGLSSVPSLIPSDGGRKNKPVAYHHLRYFFFFNIGAKGTQAELCNKNQIKLLHGLHPRYL